MDATTEARPSGPDGSPVERRSDPQGTFASGVETSRQFVRQVAGMSDGGWNRVIGFLLTLALIGISSYLVTDASKSYRDQIGQTRSWAEARDDINRQWMTDQAELNRRQFTAIIDKLILANTETNRLIIQQGEMLAKLTAVVESINRKVMIDGKTGKPRFIEE
jgi:hypothetical protein